MIDILDEFYATHVHMLAEYLPDGLTQIDLDVLQKMDLLEETALGERGHHLPQCMYAVESDEKVTLYNDYFAAWIVPTAGKDEPTTTLLIATLSDGAPKLEVGFLFKGIYNQSRTILNVLDKAIVDIKEIEQELGHIVSK